MAVISFKKIKEIAKENNKTHIVNLGKIDAKLEGINIPIKVKSFEEIIKLKNDFKLKTENLNIDYKPFTRLPKAMKEIIMNDSGYRAGITENTYYQVIKLSDDEQKIKRMKYRERLFSVLIHLDMDYKNEDGKTMWEDAEINKNDYNKLVDLFSEIIQYEEHIDILEVIINCVRDGQYTDEEMNTAISLYHLKKHLETLSEDERKEFFDNIAKAKETIDEANKKMEQDKNKKGK